MPAGCVSWIPPGVQHAALGRRPVAGWSAYLSPSLCVGLPDVEPCVLAASALVAPIVARAVAGPAGRARTPLAPAEQRLAAAGGRTATGTPRHPAPALPTDRRLLRIAQALDDPADTRPLAAWASGRPVGALADAPFPGGDGPELHALAAARRMLRALEWLAAGQPVGVVADALGYRARAPSRRRFARSSAVRPSRYFEAATISRSTATSSRSTWVAVGLQVELFHQARAVGADGLDPTGTGRRRSCPPSRPWPARNTWNSALPTAARAARSSPSCPAGWPADRPWPAC